MRIRDLTLNPCIDICCSEENTALHMKSLLEPVDNVNKVKSEEKKPRVPILDVQSVKKILCKFCGSEHAPVRKKCVCGARKRIILRKGAKVPRLTTLRAPKTWKRSVLYGQSCICRDVGSGEAREILN